MTSARPLGYLQKQMLGFMRPGQTYYLPPDALSVRIARSLESRGLIRLSNCGMSTAKGATVYLCHLVA